MRTHCQTSKDRANIFISNNTIIIAKCAKKQNKGANKKKVQIKKALSHFTGYV